MHMPGIYTSSAAAAAITCLLPRDYRCVFQRLHDAVVAVTPSQDALVPANTPGILASFFELFDAHQLEFIPALTWSS